MKKTNKTRKIVPTFFSDEISTEVPRKPSDLGLWTLFVLMLAGILFVTYLEVYKSANAEQYMQIKSQYIK